MKKSSVAVGLVAMCAAAAMALGAATDATNGVDKVSPEIKRVADAGKNAFVIFHRGGDEAAGMRESVKKAVEDAKGRAEAIEVDVADPTSAATLRNYGLNRAPMPLVLVMAPNGAVTGGFPRSCEPKNLVDAIVGPKAATCLKNLQDGKVVVVCVQNSTSTNAEATLKTVAAFKEDQRVSGFAEFVAIDPTDEAEKGFLGKLGLDLKSGIPTTLLVTPPGRIVGTYTNDLSKELMFVDLARSMAGSTCGGGGCGGGGCR